MEDKSDRGVYQARKHMAWYCKGFPGAAQLRDRLAQLESVAEGCGIIDEAIANLDNEETVNILC